MNRKQIKTDKFSATLMIGDQGEWVFGSCQSPPLGTVPEMKEYAQFITNCANVCTILNKQLQGDIIAAGERYFLSERCK